MHHPSISTRDLTLWLEAKPPSESYDWHAIRGCLLYQYLKERGYPVQCVGSTHWIDTNSKLQKWPDSPQAFIYVACEEPRTFGAALIRAKNLPKELIAYDSP